MPAPTPFFASLGYPALYLYPIDDSFAPKHISLAGGQRVKIGRQTNAKTIPGERNGYFDSKVLSRQHAEVWEENGKICIRDVKSSNGTFINGERLSPEGLESDPYDLKTDDIVEFGIDIVGEDNKTIVHHKVAARVVCVFSEQDAQAAARAEQNHAASSMHAMSGHVGPSNNGTFNFSQGGSNQRRPPLQQQGMTGMGGMGGSMRPPGKSGLTFDHILSRLQGELQKSRDTGAELHNLTGAMNEIHDTIGGALPQNLPPYPQSLPPVRPLPTQEEQQQQQQQVQAPVLSELQTQLHDTQSSLANHVDKMRALEGVFTEHEVIKREVGMIRDMMEEWKREMESLRNSGAWHNSHGRYHGGDDDDARSIDTVVPHELERVEEEDEEQLAAEEEDEERRRRREELGRPRTPEPTGMGLRDDDEEEPHSSSLHPNSRRRSRSPSSREHASLSSSVVEELSHRIATLSEQLQTALSLSSALQEQHSAAQSTISALESKVNSLESVVQNTQVTVQVQQEAISSIKSELSSDKATPIEAKQEPEHESLTAMLNDWKKGVEGQWSSVQEEWSQERERLSKARDEWENKVKVIEIGLGNTVAKVDAGLASIASHTEHTRFLPNGKELSTHIAPPSPRSLSSDSNRPRHRRRKSTSRGRTRSRSVDADNGKDEDTTASESAESTDLGHSTSTSVTSVSSHDAELKLQDRDLSAKGGGGVDTASWLNQQRSKSQPTPTDLDISRTKGFANMHPMTVQTAIGFLVLSMAAAAVAWRVKPE